MWEKNVDINEIREIRVKPNVYFGAGAIKKIGDIVKSLKEEKNVDKVIVVTGRGASKTTGAWDYVESALKANDIGYVNYDKVTPNPTTHQVDEAVKIAREFGAKAVIAIGGGSAIDAGKAAAVLMEYPGKTAEELMEFQFIAQKSVPIVAINLTHGTGTETNRFAVVTIPEKNFKPAIAYDCIYPYASIDDPQLMIKLSLSQTLYVSIDAVNHVIEASTSKLASPYSITLARETIKLVVKYLPKVIANSEDVEARYYLAYASLLGGISFDNGGLHYTHALEHPLSAVKPDLSHGLGLAMLLPAVIRYTYANCADILADILSPIVPNLKGDESESLFVAKQVEKWLFELGVTQKLSDEGFSEDDIMTLTKLAFNTPSLGSLLSIAPVEANTDVVGAIYRESMRAYN